MSLKNKITHITNNEVVRHSSIYVISSLINASIPFLLLPIMTECLSPADYAITALYQVVLGFMIPLVGVNVEAATSIEYFRNIHKNLKLFIGNALIIVSISFLIFLSLSLIFSSNLASIIDIPTKWIAIAVVQTFFQVIFAYVLVLFQVSKQPIKYGILQILLSVINAGLSIWLVWGLNWGYEGRLVGNFIAVGIIAIISTIYLVRNYKVEFKFNKIISLDILKYGAPLIPHMLGGWVMSLIDRMFLADMLGLETVGLYSVAFQLASVFGFLTMAVNQAFAPWLFGKLSQDESIRTKSKIIKFSYAIIALYLICAILYIFAMPIIKNLFINSRYHEIDMMFIVLLLGFVFQGFYCLVTNYIAYAKKTKYQAMVTVLVALIKIPMTYLFIKNFGALGAVYSFALTYFLFYFVTAIVSQKIYPMPWLSSLTKH